jgi:hypothetical protein
MPLGEMHNALYPTTSLITRLIDAAMGEKISRQLCSRFR